MRTILYFLQVISYFFIIGIPIYLGVNSEKLIKIFNPYLLITTEIFYLFVIYFYFEKSYKFFEKLRNRYPISKKQTILNRKKGGRPPNKIITKLQNVELIKETIDFWNMDKWSKRVFYVTIISNIILIYYNNEHITEGLTKVIIDIVFFIILLLIYGFIFGSILETNQKEIYEVKDLVDNSIKSIDYELNYKIRNLITKRTNKKYITIIIILTISYILYKTNN